MIVQILRGKGGACHESVAVFLLHCLRSVTGIAGAVCKGKACASPPTGPGEGTHDTRPRGHGYYSRRYKDTRLVTRVERRRRPRRTNPGTQ
jgi:hypothetical protein